MTIWGIFAYTAIPAGVLLTLLLLSEFTMLMKAQSCYQMLGTCAEVLSVCAHSSFFIIWAVTVHAFARNS